MMIGVNYDVGDYTYFDSTLCNTSRGCYDSFTAYPGGNVIECKCYDYKNPNPDRDEYILIKKVTGEPCYFDIKMEKHFLYASSLSYKYYSINARLKMPESCESFCMRCLTEAGKEADILSLTANGSVVLSDGIVSDIKVGSEEWLDAQIFINLEKSIVEYYINKQHLLSSFRLDTVIPGFIRMGIMSQEKTGAVAIDKFTITGLCKPYSDGKEVQSCIFPDEDKEKEFLKDKAAFHGYGGLMYVNGEKSIISPEPYYDKEKGELYVGYETVNKAFGYSMCEGESSITAENIRITENGIRIDDEFYDIIPFNKEGRLYIPLTRFAREILKKEVFSHETGLIIISNEKINIGQDKWQYYCLRPTMPHISLMNDIDYLNTFMTYERPDAKKLKEDFMKTGRSHPRIIATGENFEYIIKNLESDQELKKLHQRFITQADEILGMEELTYKYEDAMRTLSTARKAFSRMLLLGYAWNTTGDEKYLDKGYKELESLSTFPNYNTQHVIDSGEYNMALAVGYDWFYNGMTDEQRKLISSTILEKSLYKLALAYYGRLWGSSVGGVSGVAFRWVSNYNAVVNNGCIAAALAVCDEDADYCFDVIEKALRSLEYTMMYIALDGGWPESLAYWDYAMRYSIYGLTSLKNATGSDYGFFKTQGIRETVMFPIMLSGDDGYNNFHDSFARNGFKTSPYYLVFAKLFDIPMAARMRMGQVVEDENMPVDVFDLLYYYKSDNNEEQLKNGIMVRGCEAVSIRESYDPKDKGLYFSTHFGLSSGYHTHNDTGTFVFDMFGTRWALDLGSENYNLFNEQGVPDEHAYRKRAEGHNIVVINPTAEYNQTENRFAHITRFETNNNGGYVVADMNDIYKDAPEMKMGYYVGDNFKSLTVRYEMTLSEDDSVVYWFMHTEADVEIKGDVAYLKRAGNVLKLVFETNAQNDELYKMAAVPLETSPNPPGQTENTGVSKVVIKMKASGKLCFSVQISPDGAETSLRTQPIDEWRLEDI